MLSAEIEPCYKHNKKFIVLLCIVLLVETVYLAAVRESP